MSMSRGDEGSQGCLEIRRDRPMTIKADDRCADHHGRPDDGLLFPVMGVRRPRRREGPPLSSFAPLFLPWRRSTAVG